MGEEIRQAIPDAKKPSAILPAIGLVMALSLGGIAYFVAPMIVGFMEDTFDQFAEVREEIREEREQEARQQAALEGEEYVEGNEPDLIVIAVGVMFWFVTFSILMTIVAAVAGGNTVIDQEQRTIHPRMATMTARDAKQYEAKIEKQRKQKIAALKKMKQREEAKRKRGG